MDPPAIFDSRLIPTNGLASQIVICLVPTQHHQGVRLLSRFRASIQASAVSGPLVTALVGLIWGCFGVSVPLLPFTRLGPTSSPRLPCPSLGDSFFCGQQWLKSQKPLIPSSSPLRPPASSPSSPQIQQLVLVTAGPFILTFS